MDLTSEKRLMASIALRQRRLSELGPVLQGTLVTKYQKCSSAACPSHQGARLHPYHVVSTRVDGHTRTLYVPVGMEETVELWLSNHRNARHLLKEISDLAEQLVRMHSGRSRAAARRSAPPDSAAPGTSSVPSSI